MHKGATTLALVAALSALWPSTGAAIPAWARRYNMTCSGCHYPTPPRLNAQGIRFKWAGYRMPDEIGEPASVENVSNYAAALMRVAYGYEKTQGVPSASLLAVEQVSLFFAGPISRAFSAYVEVEREEEDDIGVTALATGTWGSENSYGGFRVGQMHWMPSSGLAGFDRPAGITTPLPLTTATTAAVPFALSGDRLGAEGFWTRGRNRLSVYVFNGIDTTGAAVSEESKFRDIAVTDQFLVDRTGAGLTGFAYYGRVDDLGVLGSTPRFWRVGLSASKMLRDLEVLGGLVWGRDQRLPTGGASPFLSATNSGVGYWLSGQYFLPRQRLAVYGRYEFADPNTDVADDGQNRVVLGSVLPLTNPQYLRLALEYWRTSPQATGSSATNNLAVQALVSF
jgi:hypothetical protein